MSGLLLLRPYWLLAVVPLVLLMLWLLRRPDVGPWTRLVDPALLGALRQLGVLRDATRRRLPLLPLAMVVMILALAGPASLRPGTTELRAVDPIILILDLSPSIVADKRALGDLQVSAVEILRLAEGRPVGMMLYAADAYLASAPSSDATALAGLVAVLEQNTLPVAGSRPDMALSMARDFFTTKPETGMPGMVGADLVLIGDGGGIGPRAIEEAARLKNDGARLWTLGLGENAKGAPAPAPQAMADLAAAGGGGFAQSTGLSGLMQQIARARTAQLIRQDSGDQSQRDLGPWLLPLALLLLFPLFRRQQ